MQPVAWLKKIAANRRTAELLAVLAVFVFLGQAFYFAHHQDVTMDEGTYLMKGLLFVKGVYRPFQDYGPWTNKMPLAFLIPGIPQVLFGPGLRTGRYFSVFLGFLILLGLWWGTRRLAGRWWATGLLWAVAANPATIAYYSVAISQVIVACQLTWMLALSLGERRPLWQTTLAAALAALMVMTRQNMLPVVPLLVLYIFWQHGKRAGWWALAVALLILAVGHWLYWPQITSIWLPWLPTALRRFLTGKGFTTSAIPQAETGAASPDSGLTAVSEWYIFWEGIRLNFIPLVGAALAWLLWPKRKAWKTPASFRASVFLSILLIGLTVAHLWAALWKDYCPYCYSGYLTFFIEGGLLLVALSFSSWVRASGTFRNGLAMVFVLACSAGIGYGANQVLGAGLLNLPVPRLRGLRFQGGSTALWRALANKFGLSFEQLQLILPIAAGALAGAVLVFAIWLLARRMRRRAAAMSFGFLLLATFFGLGSLLTPTSLFAGSKWTELCGEDVIAAHEAAGKYLASLIPPGSLVYWMNDISPLPLLYLPGIRIFPPQLNHWYTYRQSGDPQRLYRRGFWSNELAAQWREQADFLLIADRYMNSFSKDPILSRLDELAPSPSVVPCRDRAIIHVFRRVP